MRKGLGNLGDPERRTNNGRKVRTNSTAERCQLHTVMAALEQGTAEGGLQFLEALAERRLLDPADAGRAREVAFLGCGKEISGLLRGDAHGSTQGRNYCDNRWKLHRPADVRQAPEDR